MATRHGHPRRANPRRVVHRARRAAVSCRRSGNTGFAAHHSAAWWRRYWSPRQVARRKRMAAVQRRKNAIAARKARRAGLRPFPKHTAAWWNRFFAKQATCRRPPLMQLQSRKGKVPKGKRPGKAAHTAAGVPARRAAPAARRSRPQRAVSTRRRYRRH